MVKECDSGAHCLSNAATNISGVGNPVPAQSAAMTAAEQSSSDSIGSGDKFGDTMKMSTQAPVKKKARTVKFIKLKKN